MGRDLYVVDLELQRLADFAVGCMEAHAGHAGIQDLLFWQRQGQANAGKVQVQLR